MARCSRARCDRGVKPIDINGDVVIDVVWNLGENPCVPSAGRRALTIL